MYKIQLTRVPPTSVTARMLQPSSAPLHPSHSTAPFCTPSTLYTPSTSTPFLPRAPFSPLHQLSPISVFRAKSPSTAIPNSKPIRFACSSSTFYSSIHCSPFYPLLLSLSPPLLPSILHYLHPSAATSFPFLQSIHLNFRFESKITVDPQSQTVSQSVRVPSSPLPSIHLLHYLH